jgi:hypothetical protein
MRFWHRNRTDYFTQGIADGRQAAFQSLPTVGVDTAHVRELAHLAVAALPGQIAPDDTRIYESGWVEGYNLMHERAPQASA